MPAQLQRECEGIFLIGAATPISRDGDGEFVLSAGEGDDEGAMGRGADLGGEQRLHGPADGRRESIEPSGAVGKMVRRGEVGECREREGGVDAVLSGGWKRGTERD
jgi:hypothetical protein